MKIKRTSVGYYYVLLLTSVLALVLAVSLLVYGTYVMNNKTGLDDSLPQQMQQTIETDNSRQICKLDIVLMMDVSQSMRNFVNGRRKIEWARDAFGAFVNRLSTIASQPGYNVDMGLVQVGMYGLSNANLVVPLTHNYPSLTPAINTLNWIGPEGGTCLLCGLNIANNHLIDSSGSQTKKVTVLLSDGCGNHDYNDWISIPVSRGLTTAEANYGRNEHDIEYYTVGYNTEGVVGDPCGPNQYDEATLLGIAGSPTRHFFRPNPVDWIPTFEELAGMVCGEPEEISCSVQSSVSSSPASPQTIQPGTSLNIGTHFTDISPSGKTAEVRYRLVGSGIRIASPSSFNVPNPSSVSALSYYYTNINVEPIDTGLPGGQAEVAADVYIDGVKQCSASTFVKIGSLQPWWQVGSGDIVAASGSITSNVPVTPTPGKKLYSSNYSGLAIFEGSINPSVRGNIGTPGWIVDAPFPSYKTPSGISYNYGYFAGKYIPPSNVNVDTIPNASWFSSNSGRSKNGYNVYYRASTLSLNTLNFVDNIPQRIILFVNGDVNINGKILLDDGLDYFMVIARGVISINNSVGDSPPYEFDNFSPKADVEGVFVTDKEFITNVSGNSAKQLIVRGIVIGWGASGTNNGVTFGRDLGAGNTNYPSEVFQFAPDLLLNYPSFYSEQTINWREVVP